MLLPLRRPAEVIEPDRVESADNPWESESLMGNSWPASTENILFMCQINKAKYAENGENI